MRRFVLLLVVGILAVGLGNTGSQAQKIEGSNQGKKALRAIAAPLPSSLDNLFPPKAKQPIYLFRMFAMNGSFQGIIVDLFENDLEYAKANFERFKAQYIETSKLVPEWEKNSPIGPVEELGAALETGDQGKVMAAIGKVGKVCRKCHETNMVRVQQKYHWGDFNAIKVTDPLIGKEVGFIQLKQSLDLNFLGINVDLEEGQIENAQKQFQDFNARFEAMKETCMSCHDTERKYYTDESVQALIDKLGQALSESPVDVKKVGKLHQRIGMESCFKCHLVHDPAALSKF